jgi:chemotaxis protein MotB
MARNKKGPTIKKGLDDWMATYADMVTLLFCFFVMLYSAATVDEAKFQYILQSFRSDGMFINPIVGRPQDTTPSSEHDGNSDAPVDNVGDQAGNPPGVTHNPYLFDSMFSALAEIIEEHDLSNMVDISSTPGRIRIQLSNDVMFDGDSHQMNPAGRQILDLISPAITATESAIGNVEVQGHTAYTGSAWGVDSWELSAMRAITVLQYLDYEREMVASEKFKAEGFGHHDPAATNETPEGRAKNRRVEIIVNRRMDITPEEDRRATDTMAHDYGHYMHEVDAEGTRIDQPGTPVGSVVYGILGDLENRYGEPIIVARPPPALTAPAASVGPVIPGGGGQSGFVDIRDTDFLPIEEVEPAEADTEDGEEE